MTARKCKPAAWRCGTCRDWHLFADDPMGDCMNDEVDRLTEFPNQDALRLQTSEEYGCRFWREKKKGKKGV